MNEMVKALIFVIVIITILSEINGNIILEIFGNADKIAILSAECKLTLKMYVDNMKNFTDDDMWALKMWDATSKIPVGLISYNFEEMGNFEQCVYTKSVSDNIVGKYCLGNIAVTNSSHSHNDIAHEQTQVNWKKLISVVSTGLAEVSSPTWAICIPSNCSDDDALNILNGIRFSGLYFESVVCQTTNDAYPQLTTEAIIGILIVSVIISTMALSTCCDLHCRLKGGDPSHVALIAFSVYTNGEKLFHMKKNHDELSVLNGMRFISVIWILVGHTRYVYNMGPVSNSKNLVELTYSFIITIFLSDICAVDTFLMIGGVLVSYVFFKRKRNEETFNIFQHYFHRYMRLTPSLAGIVLLHATLLRYTGSGPHWSSDKFEGCCKKYWWSTLLYIQNYVNVNEMCVAESWYLNIDMQLYLLSPLILYLLNKRPKTAIFLLVLASLVSIFTGFWIAYDDQLYINSEDTPPKVFPTKSWSDFSVRTHCRASPWFIGIILGYLLTRDTAKTVNITQVLLTLAWIFSFVVMTICVFGGHALLSNPNHDRIGNTFLLVFQKPVWSICIGWMIWACGTNRGGVINAILSHRIFQFLNQFTYSIYLLHLTILQMIVWSQKIPFYYTVLNLVYCSCGIFMFTFGISIIWVLAFESPVIALEKIMWKNK